MNVNKEENMRKLVMGMFVGVAGAALLLQGCSVFGVRDTPMPDYKVLTKANDGDVEVREYKEMMVAKTSVKAEYKDAQSIMFKRLANYIFGENSGDEEIGMTAPVIQEDTKKEGENIGMTAPVFQNKVGDTWEMTFVMPARYTMETLPKPVDPNITIELLPPKTTATLRFSGFLSEGNIEEHKRELRKWVEASTYKAVSSYRSAGYDAPFTIPFLRRNEILVDVVPKDQ